MYPQIEGYRFGRITIDGQQHTNDLIILPDRIVTHWWRETGHELRPIDVEAVLDAEPELLVVGTGAYGRMRVTDETRRVLQDAGIRLIVQPTDDAVQTYEQKAGETRLAFALHVTC
jgi:hypothetical protein